MSPMISMTLIIFLSLVLMLGFGYAAWRFRRSWLGVPALVFSAAGAALLVWSMLNIVPYMWAIHLEEKWSPVNPTTKAQLESYLSLYSHHQIRPSESMWGHSHVLRQDERMTQYLLMWRMPLDVVYDRDDRIVAIYTSYE